MITACDQSKLKHWYDMKLNTVIVDPNNSKSLRKSLENSVFLQAEYVNGSFWSGIALRFACKPL